MPDTQCMEEVRNSIKDIKEYLEVVMKTQNEKADTRVKYFEAERDRLDGKNNELRQIIDSNHKELKKLVKETIALQKKTNSRVHKLEIWKSSVKSTIKTTKSHWTLIVGFIGWTALMIVTWYK